MLDRQTFEVNKKQVLDECFSLLDEIEKKANESTNILDTIQSMGRYAMITSYAHQVNSCTYEQYLQGQNFPEKPTTTTSTQ